MYKTPTNKEIAALFNAIADSLEIRSVDEYRVRAFRNGARNIEGMDIDVADAVSDGRLDLLPGIGQKLGGVIDEYVRTRTSQELDQAREGIPPGLFEVLEIRGLGPKTVGKLFEELKIEDLDSLEQTATSGTLRSVPGMGAKKVETILLEIQKLRERRGRRLLATASPVAQAILGELLNVEGVANGTLVGEARRGVPVVSGISFLVATNNPGAVVDRFRSIVPTSNASERSASGTFEDGFEAHLTVCPPASFSANLVFETGSDAHSHALWSIARERGVELDNGAAFANEEELYEALGLPLIPPELREGGDEIGAAQNGGCQSYWLRRISAATCTATRVGATGRIRSRKWPQQPANAGATTSRSASIPCRSQLLTGWTKLALPSSPTLSKRPIELSMGSRSYMGPR